MAQNKHKEKTRSCELSVVIVIGNRMDDVTMVYTAYRDAIAGAGGTFEFVYVLDGQYEKVEEELKNLQAEGEPIVIVQLPRHFGEATALSAGIENSAAERIMTLPPYLQIEPTELSGLAGNQLTDCDMLICRRWPRKDPSINRIASKLFHLPTRWISGLSVHDLGCSVRLFNRHIVDEVRLYGDQHRFLPLLAYRQGFRVVEVSAKQAQADMKPRVYAPRVYVQRTLDLLSMFFLIRFTRKPLRFFGLIGSASFGIGSLMLLVLGFQRIFFDMPLANRPIVLLASLLVVLGFQFFAMGLIGEIIIFTQSRSSREYTVDKVVRFD